MLSLEEIIAINKEASEKIPEENNNKPIIKKVHYPVIQHNIKDLFSSVGINTEIFKEHLRVMKDTLKDTKLPSQQIELIEENFNAREITFMFNDTRIRLEKLITVNLMLEQRLQEEITTNNLLYDMMEGKTQIAITTDKTSIPIDPNIM